ncbi:uncharacterized protein LOC144925429 [Branchiostoma floridae x Branchiostoma belcheri]
MKLQHLEVLFLGNNKNITLPDEMCSLTNLSVLCLANCDLKSVPDVVGKLTQLNKLRLWNNKKIKLPGEMSSLVNLIYLNLEGCDLDTLPPVVLKLSNLQELDLSNNRISLPDELYKLENMKVLRLCNTNLATVRPAVVKLTQLEELDLSENRRIHLPDELSGLNNIRVLKLEGTGMVTVPPVVWRLTQLEWLDLSDNPLQMLPTEIGQLTNMKHLDLRMCQLHTLPPEVWRLTQLEWLNLSSNQLQTLPAEIGQLTNIEHLDLSNCELRTLPPDVWRLTQLEWLNLSSNPLQTLPAEIGKLTNIKDLHLSNCELHTLPLEVWTLTQLEWLNLKDNPLQTLPAEIGQLANIKHLHLSNCELRTLPPEVWRLTQLEWLDLRSNPLQMLPAEIGKLANIKHLDLSFCELRTLPPEVGRLTQLEWLNLSSNPLQTLLAEIGKLTNIKHLHLSNCELRTLPLEVWTLTQLEWLDLRDNPLQTLPADIGQLTNIKHLHLSYCKLRTLPSEVGRLTQLEWLDLSSNPLQTLPAEIGQVTNIKHLHLSYCKLRTLPSEVGRLTQLEWLGLSSNPLQALPAEIGQLTNIKHLDLSNCKLRTLPSEVGRLAQLEWLDLSSNPLQTLPAEIGQLTNIKHLHLSNCKLRTLPPDVWRLTQLEWLNLRSNPLQMLSAEIEKLTNIKHLHLSNCELRTLPLEVWRLAQLEMLDLSSNSLQTLPAEIGQLTNIKHLDLSNCELRTLPPHVWRLTQLEWLDLSSNSLQTLPAEIGQLTNIKHLDLSNCELRTLPPDVWRLTQLEWLNLRSNPLQMLSAEIEKLTNIKHLHLSNCELRTLPLEVWRLAQLEMLDLSSNSLQTLPAEIGQLTNIKHLDLSNCELRTLPPDVWRLTQLEWLDLSSNSLQTLPAEIGQLTNIKHLDLSNCELRTLPPDVWRLTQLEWLNLRSNPLQMLPAKIGQLTNIEHLDLSKCELRTLPSEVGRLTQLEWLDLRSNPLQKLPAEIGQLTNIKHLDLFNCKLHTLPSEVWGLTQLERLDLSSNPLQKLPAEIGKLTNIKHLHLSNCKLRTLPLEVWTLTQLERLDLSSNPLQTLPAEIGKLTNIKHLHLSNCELRTLPLEVWTLTQLEWLDLSSNPLQTLPAEIGQITNIEHLDLSKCELRTLPSKVWTLTQLEWLDLSSNPLQTLSAEIGKLTNINTCICLTANCTLPAEIGQVTNIKHLHLSNCDLRTLPLEVWTLTQLEWLDLSSNPLQTLPAEIGQLTNIKHLHLSNCELRTLPPDVWRLTQLEWLNLSSNPLQTLPAKIGQLTNIEHLDLSKCELRTLPSEVGRLTQLEMLDLRSNPLQTLPAEIGQLTDIEHLDLSECELRTLPPEVGRLTHLEWLLLDDNSLEALPVEIAQLTNVSDLDVSGNPLIKPPAEVCSHGINAIRKYFDELEHSEEEVSARLKVVVLGEKMAGKTSLVQTLSRSQSSLTKEEDRTHCVEITQWAPDDNITFEVYDFGGHDVYHLTHQFFLTQGALNLLTVNLLKYRCTEQGYTEAVGFWLDTLNARVPGAVVTIVGSKTDLCSDTEIEEKTRDIQARFSQQHDMWKRTIQQQMKKLESNRATNEGTDQGEIERQLERTRDLLTRPLRLTGVYCVSSAEPTSGLDKLKSHILKTANNTSLFPSVRRILPRTWVEFDQHLRDMRGNGTEEYQSARSTSQVGPVQSIKSKWLTREECLKQGQLAGLTADRLEPALSYLQQVGTILRYTDIPELKDLVFHDPSGLIDVMKELFHHDLRSIFNNKNPRLKSFSNTHLKKIRKNLSSRGFLPREVVIALLGPHATPVGNVDVITSLMEHFGLCYTEWSDEQEGETSTSVGYYIPWYIKEERPEANRDATGQEFIVTCEIAHFCPRGLFERLSVVINKLIKSRQDWKDLVSAVTDSFPVIVYREKKDEHVNIVVRLTVPAQAVQGTQVIWDTISPLKDKLSTLLKEWPGLLYRLVYSTFIQPAKQKGDQQTLSVASIIPTFEVGPRGCTVQHGGVTLEFPEGCVRDTRFISVEVEAVPVTEDVRTNFTAMSAVLTVEQDFPQRFLRPVTVRLPWVWTQAAAGKQTTTTVVLHCNRGEGWTVFKADAHQEDGGIMFQTDHFQSFWAILHNWLWPGNEVRWARQTWNDYIEDKVYVIVTPDVNTLPERILRLISLYKTDDIHEHFQAPDLRFESQIKQQVEMTNDQTIKATFGQDEDVVPDPRDLREGESMDLRPRIKREVRLRVKESAPQKPIYEGKVKFTVRDLNNQVETRRQEFEVFVKLRPQGGTPDTSVLEDEYQHVALRHENTGLRERSPSQQHQQARPQPTVSSPPRQTRYKPNVHIAVAIVLAVVAMIVHLFYSSDYIADNLFRLPGGGEDASQNSKLQMGRWLPLTFVAGLFTVIFGIWLFVFRKGPRVPKVLLLNDEYGTSKGGISTINCQLGQMLVEAKAVVYCTALRVPEQDREAADRDGVQLIQPDRLGQKTDPTLDWLTYYHSVHFPNLPQDVTCIIGHADITDTAAKNIKDQRYPEADLVMFTHVLPEDTDYYKGGRKALKAWQKEKDMLDKVDNAKASFSVGKRIFEHFDNMYRGDKKPQSHEIFLPKPSEMFLNTNVRPGGEQKVVLSIGRVRKVEKLKGHDLAGRSLRDVVKRVTNVRWCVRGISEDDHETSKKILEDNLSSPDLIPTLRSYGTQADIRDDMMTAHLVLMPSRSEPFGLVGLEAIAAGIPVLISDKTGLAEMINDLINDKKLSEEHRHVIVETSVNDSDPAGDAKRWADKIVDILKHSDSEFEKAARFKKELVESRYWEESHNEFLQTCGIKAADQ